MSTFTPLQLCNGMSFDIYLLDFLKPPKLFISLCLFAYFPDQGFFIKTQGSPTRQPAAVSASSHHKAPWRVEWIKVGASSAHLGPAKNKSPCTKAGWGKPWKPGELLVTWCFLVNLKFILKFHTTATASPHGPQNQKNGRAGKKGLWGGGVPAGLDTLFSKAVENRKTKLL